MVMSQIMKKYQLKFQESAPWIIAAITVLSANWAADAFLETFSVWWRGNRGAISWPRITYIVFFILMVRWLYVQRKAFFRPHTRHLSNEPAERRKHLVLFLSNLASGFEKTGGVPERLRISKDIRRDIQELEMLKKSNPPVRWSWEMPLRAIEHHLGTLESVTLICSRESLSQANLFLNICRHYDQLRPIIFYVLAQRNRRSELICPSSSVVIDSHQGFDFESFDELSQAMSILLREFRRQAYSEDEIMIDITGGQKPTSIVAASITFNLKVKAQYVQTNHPWGVLSYDVVLASTDTGGFGV